MRFLLKRGLQNKLNVFTRNQKANWERFKHYNPFIYPQLCFCYAHKISISCAQLRCARNNNLQSYKIPRQKRFQDERRHFMGVNGQIFSVLSSDIISLLKFPRDGSLENWGPFKPLSQLVILIILIFSFKHTRGHTSLKWQCSGRKQGEKCYNIFYSTSILINWDESWRINRQTEFPQSNWEKSGNCHELTKWTFSLE